MWTTFWSSNNLFTICFIHVVRSTSALISKCRKFLALHVLVESGVHFNDEVAEDASRMTRLADRKLASQEDKTYSILTVRHHLLVSPEHLSEDRRYQRRVLKPCDTSQSIVTDSISHKSCSCTGSCTMCTWARRT